MALNWDVKRTRDLVLSLYGKPKYLLASASFRSVLDRLTYAAIHYHDALNLFDKFVADKLKDRSLQRLVFSRDEEAIDEFQVFTTTAAAHVTAFIQSVHTIPDTLGYSIYHSLALDSVKQLNPDKISAWTVLKILEGEPELVRLATLLGDLLREGGFPHLSAAANHSKHRSIVLSGISENLNGTREDKYILQLGWFEYGGVAYPAVPLRGFLEAEVDRCGMLVYGIANELTSILELRCLKPRPEAA